MAKMDAFEMFRTGCKFSDCADLCLKGQDRAPESNLAYITPAIVNASFSCEVFLKLLLQHEGKDIHKIHMFMRGSVHSGCPGGYITTAISIEREPTSPIPPSSKC